MIMYEDQAKSKTHAKDLGKGKDSGASVIGEPAIALLFR